MPITSTDLKKKKHKLYEFTENHFWKIIIQNEYLILVFGSATYSWYNRYTSSVLKIFINWNENNWPLLAILLLSFINKIQQKNISSPVWTNRHADRMNWKLFHDNFNHSTSSILPLSNSTKCLQRRIKSRYHAKTPITHRRNNSKINSSS